jgi:HPr kinase/phosphorylase
MAITRETVTVESFYTQNATQLHLKLIAGAGGLKRIIRESTVNRPGLALTGFTKYFAMKRVQVFGNAEYYYCRSLEKEERTKRYEGFFRYAVPCVVFSRELEPDKQFLQAAEKADVPVFTTSLITMKFINAATIALDAMFAPKGTEMGSMVDILGVGVIIKGESGIGKSESVLALVERGYSLVSDDITLVTLVDGRKIIGTSKELTRNLMEVRGIGIVDVASMFGVKSIRKEKRVDLVVSLVAWDPSMNIDRLGMEQEYTRILSIEIPHMKIPVRPGRDLGRLIEVAAFHTKLRMSGLNPAKELNDRLVSRMRLNQGL